MASGIKVVHLCTADTGGAAIAAQRLHHGLLQAGVDSSFLTLQQANPNQYPKKIQFKKASRKPTLTERFKSKLGIAVTQAQRNKQLIHGLTGTYETFSFPQTDHRPESDALLQNADIVHLHWISYFVNYPTFFSSIRQPIVWTFHDMNPMQGGFHYAGDKERNAAFAGIEETLRKEKAAFIKAHNDITVVTPSLWLGKLAQAREPFKNRPYHHIPYGLDMSVFKPHDRAFSRRVFNFDPDKKIILFVTERVSNYRKGFDLLIEAVRELPQDDRYAIVTIGESTPELSALPNVVSLGRVHDEYLLSVLYSAADVFVLPSREDNFPNVMLESVACGTPVVAFNTGGMKEVIVHGQNGILAEAITPAALGGALRDFMQGKYVFNRQAIREAAVRDFDLLVQANRYKALYDEIASAKGGVKR
jgi:glycosyltransferase involved in cell wall biosynthesis